MNYESPDSSNFKAGEQSLYCIETWGSPAGF